MQEAIKIINDHIREGARLRESYLTEMNSELANCGLTLAKTIAAGGKILICGNGGSAADAQHFAAELVGRFVLERPALPAIALTVDSSILTAIANDYGFEHVFARQVSALARPGDVLIAISTSGNSPNVLRALELAKSNKVLSIGLTGGDGGKMKEYCEQIFIVPHKRTALIQETHIAICHILCNLIDYFMFENASSLQKKY